MKLKNIKGKRLNNKGFTLIELLAVVVILAVVMGIAMTSVLSSMNKSRGGSLQDSAQSVNRSFNQAYTESLVGSSGPTSVLGMYNFTGDAAYYIDDSLADEFSMSTSNYELYSGDTAPTNLIEGDTTEITVDKSFVAYDSATSKFLVCLKADANGSYFVRSYSKTGNGNIADAAKFIMFGSNSDRIKYTFADGSMFACYNGSQFVTTWEKPDASTQS